MTDTDIHSCGYYCDRHACIVAQRNELRDKLFSNQAVKTYSGGKPNYTQPEPEPVAYMDSEGHLYNSTTHPERYTPLYTTPPQRKEWQGLTDDEMLMIYMQPHEGFKYSLGRMVQAALKEKNA